MTQAVETEGSIMPTDPEALVMRKLLLFGLSQVTICLVAIVGTQTLT